METRHVYLRPVEKTDMVLLYKWRNSEVYREFFFGRRSILSWEDFEAEYKKDVQKLKHVQFLVCRRPNGEGIGLVYSYTYSAIDGHLFMGVFMDERFRKRGHGAEASVLLITYLFNNYPIHKVSADIYSYNIPSLTAAKNLGFVVEGEFKNHRFYNGEYWNVIRLALYRENICRLRAIHSRIVKTS